MLNFYSYPQLLFAILNEMCVQLRQLLPQFILTWSQLCYLKTQMKNVWQFDLTQPITFTTPPFFSPSMLYPFFQSYPPPPSSRANPLEMQSKLQGNIHYRMCEGGGNVKKKVLKNPQQYTCVSFFTACIAFLLYLDDVTNAY